MTGHLIDLAGVLYIAALAYGVLRIVRADAARKRANRHAATSRLAPDPRGEWPRNHKRGTR